MERRSMLDPPARREVPVDPLMPPPVRRIVLERDPTVVSPPSNGSGATTATTERPAAPASRASGQAPAADVQERMRIEAVWLAYGENWVVRDVSLPVRKGEVLGLIGASGSGKTTLLRSLNRLTEITAGAARAGRITLDGQEIGEIEVNVAAPARVDGLPAAQPVPDEHLRERRLRAARGARRRGARRRKRRSRDDLMPAVIDALRRAGLYEEVADDLDHPALRLSGGQQQRLCIARALAAGPEVLLLDEPCSALDPISTATIEELIVGLRESVAIVIVTHNLQQALRVADHVAFMHLGELVEYGPASRSSTTPAKQRTREYVSGAFG